MVCHTDVVTLCQNCTSKAVDLAKWATWKIGHSFRKSNLWALQHVDGASVRKVGKGVQAWDLRIHMKETSCSRDEGESMHTLYTLYTGQTHCLVDQQGPDNLCEVRVLSKGKKRMMTKRTCAGHNVSSIF